MDETAASFLDKTDWRITLHRKLEACVDAEGTEFYPKRVKSLISVASATFPGWDAKTDIENEIKRLQEYYTGLWTTWFEDHGTAKRERKYQHKKQLYLEAHKSIFEYIKNMCARKRMLLWGSKKIPGGSQIEYEDE